MSGGVRRARDLLDRIIGLADKPTDDDDLHLRKRVVLIAGYVLIVAALQRPFLAQGHPLGWFVAATIPLVSAVNLLVLARTGRFERYVNVLIVMVLLLPALIEVSLGERTEATRQSPVFFEAITRVRRALRGIPVPVEEAELVVDR